jgi:predicted SAM-dependent methyltransferase
MDQMLAEPGQIALRPTGGESGKTIAAKHRDGFVARYLSGANILDIGFRGYSEGGLPIVPQAKGIDLDYPGYDGKRLPFADDSQDAVFSSHCLEHIEDFRGALREWHRVLRAGGFLIIAVPHQFLYERRVSLPSRWNQDHRRFYTPASLMAEVEASLEPNTYRLRHLIDNDQHYIYSRSPDVHPGGCYEIEMVIEKIAAPAWVITDLAQVEVDPQTEQIKWIGFGECTDGVRWSEGTTCSMRFTATDELARAMRVQGARILLTIDTYGMQRVRTSLNDKAVNSATLEGAGRRLEIPTARMRAGLNTVRFDLPAAIHPVSASDPRRLGISVRRIMLLRRPWQEDQGGLMANLRSVLPRLIELWRSP